jgi:hypothetical protein
MYVSQASACSVITASGLQALKKESLLQMNAQRGVLFMVTQKRSYWLTLLYHRGLHCTDVLKMKVSTI